MSNRNRPLQRSKLPQPAHRRRRINQVRESLGLRSPTPRRSVRWSRVLLLFSFLFLLGAGALYASQYFKKNPENFGIIKDSISSRGKSIREIYDNKENVIFLLAGIDGEPPGRSDTIILVNFDTRTYQTRMLSLPRDTWVQIADEEDGHDKLTHSFARGEVKHNKELLELKKANPELKAETAITPDNGISYLMNTIELFFDHQITIDHYIAVKFEGFEKIVDALGGCDINVEKRMKYSDRSQNLKIDLQPGIQHLDGKNTLCYARFRHDAVGDLGRMERQQRVLSALAKQIKNPANVASWVQVYSIVIENTKTDLDVKQLKALGTLAGKYDAHAMLKAFTMDSTSDSLRSGLSIQRVSDDQKAQALDFLLNLSPDSTIPRTGTHGIIAKELGEYEQMHPELEAERYATEDNEGSENSSDVSGDEDKKTSNTVSYNYRKNKPSKSNSTPRTGSRTSAKRKTLASVSRNTGSSAKSKTTRRNSTSSTSALTSGKIPSHPPAEKGEAIPVKSKSEGE